MVNQTRRLPPTTVLQEVTVHYRNSNLDKQRTARQDDEREKDNLSPRPT